MDAFHQGFLHAVSQACGLSLSLFELLSVLTFLLLCRHWTKQAGHRHCVSESSRGGNLIPFYNGIISRSGHWLKAEVAFASAVYPTHRATLLLLSVKLEGTQGDSSLPNCGLEFSPTYQPGTLALSFLELLKTHKMTFHDLCKMTACEILPVFRQMCLKFGFCPLGSCPDLL